MTVTPEEIPSLPREVWRRLAAGEDSVHLRAGTGDMIFRILPMAPVGGAVADLFRALGGGAGTDEEGMESFARNVEEGRRLMNQPLPPPWDT